MCCVCVYVCMCKLCALEREHPGELVTFAKVLSLSYSAQGTSAESLAPNCNEQKVFSYKDPFNFGKPRAKPIKVRSLFYC